jgi:hypothetical protein
MFSPYAMLHTLNFFPQLAIQLPNFVFAHSCIATLVNVVVQFVPLQSVIRVAPRSDECIRSMRKVDIVTSPIEIVVRIPTTEETSHVHFLPHRECDRVLEASFEPTGIRTPLPEDRRIGVCALVRSRGNVQESIGELGVRPAQKCEHDRTRLNEVVCDFELDRFFYRTTGLPKQECGRQEEKEYHHKSNGRHDRESHDKLLLLVDEDFATTDKSPLANLSNTKRAPVPILRNQIIKVKSFMCKLFFVN